MNILHTSSTAKTSAASAVRGGPTRETSDNHTSSTAGTSAAATTHAQANAAIILLDNQRHLQAQVIKHKKALSPGQTKPLHINAPIIILTVNYSSSGAMAAVPHQPAEGAGSLRHAGKVTAASTGCTQPRTHPLLPHAPLSAGGLLAGLGPQPPACGH